METFEVVMIGNSRAGKTSMLSALSNELAEYNTRKIQLEPTSHDFTLLQERWNEMIERVESQAPFTILTDEIPGDLNITPFKFDFKVEGSKEAAVLFTDTKGGMTRALEKQLIERVNGAFGVYCVVDASVMMECSASKNERFNCPKTVKRLLSDVYNDGDGKQPRFVVFVLTKCEKYMATKKGQVELAKAFHEKYDNILKMLETVECPPKVYVVGIQTMTCVSFLKLNAEGWPEFRVLPAKELKTKDCAYPLVILLKELINAIEESRRGIFAGPIDWLLKLLGIRKNLKAYLAEVESKIEMPTFYEEL